MVCGWNCSAYFGSIFVDNDKANESISKTEGKAEGLGGKLGGMIGTAAKWGAALFAGAGVAVGGMLALANKTAETADVIDKLSERTGINREELQRWKYAAEQSGGDIGKLEVGMKKLSDVMDGASNGSKANVEAFGKLGISMDDLKSKSQSDIFDDVMNALADMPQGAERNALGNDLLGKSYTELLPLLNAGSEGMTGLKDRADELGLVMSEDMVKANVVFGDTMADVKAEFGMVFMTISNQMLPTLQLFLDFILAHMPEIQSIFSIVFDVIAKVIKVATDVIMTYLMPWLESLFEWIEANLPEIQAFFKTVFETIGEIIKAFVEIATTLWNKYGEDIKRITEVAFGIVKTIVETVMGVIKGIINTVLGLLTGDWQRAWDGIKQIFSSVWNGMKDLLPQLLEGIYAVLRGAFNIFRDLGSGMFNMVWEGMKGIWSSISSWVGEKVNWLADKLTFWKKSESTMNKSNIKTTKQKNDGSHANGLDYVPFDGYIAELHRGERVLTAKENASISKGSGQKIENNYNIASLVVREEADIKKIARELYNLQRSTGRGLGMA